MGRLHLNSGRLAVLGRRLCLAGLVLATVLSVSWRLLAMLQVNGWTPLKGMISVLFVLLLVPIALSFWTALIGFLILWRRGHTLPLNRAPEPAASPPPPLPRTAIIMPIHNEEPTRVFAGLKATYESLRQTDRLPAFDFFVLSDSTDPDLWVREELAFAEWQKEVDQPSRLQYRNRRENTERKTGNIADFCERWGALYKYMIVFDADSIMTGASLVNLVRLMEANPDVGIVQAPPLPVNRRTLFGRLHQFAMQAYSAVFINGLNFWQGGEANYWGHNAIIRLQPFIKHCRLPRLSGPPPLGGSILSHDCIEAALMRRAGWKVYLAGDLRGSYEELPSSLIGYTARDRRWCQGNLQHARLLATPGFHPISRLHLSLGLMAYLASPLWMLLLALTTLEGIRQTLGAHLYFPPRPVLFPIWQISVQHQATHLFGLVLALLLLPKLLSLLLSLRYRQRLAGFGGALKFGASVLCETFASTLLAPNLALLHTRFVIGILLGRDVKWDSPDRGEVETSFREAFRRHWPATLLGLSWVLLLAMTVPKLLWWFSPILAGLLLAIPLSAWSSRTRAGDWARRHSLFLIPEELAPPPLLRHLHHELERAPSRPWGSPFDGLARVLEDPQVRALHLALLQPAPAPKDRLREHYLQGLQLKLLHHGLHSLSPREKRELLLDADSIRALRIPQPNPLPPARPPAPDRREWVAA